MLEASPLIIRIRAGGAPLSLSLGSRVTRFSYEDVQKGDDMLEVTFSDPFNKLIDTEQFLENTKWEVSWGFASKIHAARTVLVKQPTSRWGEVEIKALDQGSKLKIEERWEVAQNKSIGNLVTDIAKRNGLKAQIDAGLSEVLGFFAFGGRTDYEILQYLSTRAGDHVFKVINDKLIFKKRTLDAAPSATFEFAPGRSSRLLSFEVTSKDQANAKNAKQTTAVDFDPETMKRRLFKSDESTSQETNLGPRRVHDKYLSSFSRLIPGLDTISKIGGKKKAATQGQSTGKSIVLPPKTQKEIEDIANALRRKGLLDSVEARFEIAASPTDPFLKSGDIIEILGIGAKYSGKWYIAKISHNLGTEGYVYSIEGKRNAVGGKGSLKGQNKKSKALAGGFDATIFSSKTGLPIGGGR